MDSIAQLIDAGTPEARLVFKCPGCKCSHGVPVSPHPRAWEWNGSLERPTLAPSILISYEPHPPRDRPAVCHSFVRDGNIEFCGDSQHEFAGKSVPLQPI